MSSVQDVIELVITTLNNKLATNNADVLFLSGSWASCSEQQQWVMVLNGIILVIKLAIDTQKCRWKTEFITVQNVYKAEFLFCVTESEHHCFIFAIIEFRFLVVYQQKSLLHSFHKHCALADIRTW